MARPKKEQTVTESMNQAQEEADNKKIARESSEFDFTNYQISTSPEERVVTIPDTGDSFKVTLKQLSWSRRNQILAESIKWNADGNTAFNSDVYVRSCLKEVLVDAPWGRTTEAFLISIDSRMGAALEALVPKAFGESADEEVETLKKEQAHS